MELRTFVHYGLHFIVPLLVTVFFFRRSWKMVYGIFLLGMLIDLDHLLATPIFDPNRCSINFHPLHSYYAIVVYFTMLFFRKTRLLALGLLFHILADAADCWMMAF